MKKTAKHHLKPSTKAHDRELLRQRILALLAARGL